MQNPAAERNMIAKILKPLNRAYRYNITTRHAKKAADSVIGSPTGINQFAPGVMRSNMRSIIRIVADSPVISIQTFRILSNIKVRNNHAETIDASA